ncbi:hypothetical protein [Streptosporangium saharense]|uniref:Uncharacterized protein n=1 Tax=Streptosporangium saharense TaxID=1706840 RepID=A0A7W7VSH2_9ACTN|nr:hypothetical protein [Streptosporangium saharense]MBB4920758.1 hypothetical protein [Streptosporangium saharense]
MTHGHVTAHGEPHDGERAVTVTAGRPFDDDPASTAPLSNLYVRSGPYGLARPFPVCGPYGSRAC